MSETMVRVVDVHKSYLRGKQAVEVLHGLTLDIPRAEATTVNADGALLESEGIEVNRFGKGLAVHGGYAYMGVPKNARDGFVERVDLQSGARTKLGAQLGTTSYQFIVDNIKPSSKPAVFPQNAGAIASLKNGQIDGLVVDLPTAFYVTAVQVPNSTILGQFSTKAGGEHFGMVFEKGNPLARCVNAALATLKANGSLARIQQQWLAKATGAPVLK